MKRSLPVSESESEIFITSNTKRIKQSAQSPSRASEVLNDENLLYEILKHVDDERTLGSLSCVSKQWNRTAQDERLWEMICTKHWTNMACGDNKLRSVVLALGGFRKLHAHYLYPLSKSSGSTTGLPSSSSAVAAAVSGPVWPCLPPRQHTVGCEKSNCLKTHYGQDEVQLSLSLLSIRYFETIRFRNRND
ncbi:putative F-box domain-containing protein [Helianthus anomalus]